MAERVNVASQAVTPHYVTLLANGGKWVQRGGRRVVRITAIDGVMLTLRTVGEHRTKRQQGRMEAAIFLRAYRPASE